MAQLILTGSARPPWGGIRVLMDKGAIPFFESMGDIDYQCACGATLVKGATEEYRFTEFVFRCPQCGNYSYLSE